MKTLVSKMSSLKLLKIEMFAGALVMAIAIILLPVGVITVDIELLANPYILGVLLIGALFFASVGYFIFIRPYIVYRKLPTVQVETDGEYLYIHTKKEAKIPLSSLDGAIAYSELPFIYQKEFLREIIIHLFSDEYGIVVLEIPDYGTFKMRFVSYADRVAQELANFIAEATSNQ